MDVVEDEAELVHVSDGLLVGADLHLQGRSEAADGGRVQHFANLETNQIKSTSYTCPLYIQT